jgi:hypothetical protein
MIIPRKEKIVKVLIKVHTTDENGKFYCVQKPYHIDNIPRIGEEIIIEDKKFRDDATVGNVLHDVINNKITIYAELQLFSDPFPHSKVLYCKKKIKDLKGDGWV